MTPTRLERCIVSVSPEEEIFLQGIASDRADMGKSERFTVSYFSPYQSALQAITSEYLVARTLGCLFNPAHFKGGDGHKKDLWRGPVTLSLKTRGSHLPADFIFPPGQNPGEFPDDYGIVGKWRGPKHHPYRDLELVGYFSYFDWDELHETIKLPWVKEGTTSYREAYVEKNLRPIAELVYDLERVPSAEISSIQDYGYQRYFGDWYRSGGYPVL